MSLEAKIEAMTASVDKNNALLEQLIAGREDALAQLKNAASPAATVTRSRAKKTDDAPAAGAETAAAATVTRPVDATNDDLKTRVAAWLGTDPAQIAERKPQLAALLAQLGSPAIAGEKSTITDEQRYQATFYIERFKAGLPVDFAAEYDFDGAPDQVGSEPAAAAAPVEEDMLG